MDDKLRAMARQAVVDADPAGVGGVRMQAVKLLRERDDKRRRMQDYIGAINWALEHRPAADLPDGSVVATTQQVWIKDHPDSDHQWSCSDGCPSDDADIDRYLELGLQVLRVGTGKDGL
jgi:hypothetical protein